MFDEIIKDTLKAVHKTQGIVEAPAEDVPEPGWQEANTPDGMIPDSWVDEKGIRHCVIWDLSYPDHCRVIKVNDKWELVENAPF